MIGNKLTVAIKGMNWILQGVLQSFQTPENSTSRQVRINGAICVGVGFFSLFIGLLCGFLGNRQMVMLLMSVFLVAAYACWLVGGYKLVFGMAPQAKPGEILSFHRTVFGVCWAVLMVAIPVLLLLWIGPMIGD